MILRSSPVDTLSSGDPQFKQKRAPSGFLVAHLGQTITTPSLARAVSEVEGTVRLHGPSPTARRSSPSLTSLGSV